MYAYENRYESYNRSFHFFLVKHNKITQGLITQDQCVRDVDLFTLEGDHTNLLSHIPAGQPLVLLAGSTS
jgi:hypothetical protein